LRQQALLLLLSKFFKLSAESEGSSPITQEGNSMQGIVFLVVTNGTIP